MSEFDAQGARMVISTVVMGEDYNSRFHVSAAT